jgi:hypothetical protein
MSFQRADHHILRAKVSRFLAGRYPGGLFLTVNSQAQPIALDRLEMDATRDDAHIIAGERKLDREVTTDRSGAVHTDLHVILISAKNPARRATATSASPASSVAVKAASPSPVPACLKS